MEIYKGKINKQMHLKAISLVHDIKRLNVKKNKDIKMQKQIKAEMSFYVTFKNIFYIILIIVFIFLI